MLLTSCSVFWVEVLSEVHECIKCVCLADDIDVGV